MAARLVCQPTHIHLTPSTPVDPSTALSEIQTFLAETAVHAHLHPDCTFSEAGPQVSNIEHGGIILHQLRRVEKGLRGIVLKPEVESELENMDGLEGIQNLEHAAQTGELPESHDKRLDARIAAMTQDAEEDFTQDVDMLNGEPIENYQHQLYSQGVGTVEGEIGDRNPAATNGDAVLPSVLKTDPSGKKRRAEEMEAGKSKADKEARKRAKKEKQRERAQERSTPKKIRIADDEVNGEASHEPTLTYSPTKISSSSLTGKPNGAVPPSPQKSHKKKHKDSQGESSQEALRPSQSSGLATESQRDSQNSSSKDYVPMLELETPVATPVRIVPQNGVTVEQTAEAIPKKRSKGKSKADGDEPVKKRKKKRKENLQAEPEPEQSALDMPLNTPALTNGRKSKSIQDYDKDRHDDRRAERRRLKKLEKLEKRKKRAEEGEREESI